MKARGSCTILRVHSIFRIDNTSLLVLQFTVDQTDFWMRSPLLYPTWSEFFSVLELISMTKANIQITINNIELHYSTLAPYYHIWSRKPAKYETVIHCSVPV